MSATLTRITGINLYCFLITNFRAELFFAKTAQQPAVLYAKLLYGHTFILIYSVFIAIFF